MDFQKTKKIIVRISLVLLGLLALICIAISVVLYIVVTPAKVTPVVLNLVNDQLNAKVDCESVDITFFSTFPNLGIRLQNGSIVNTVSYPGDSIDRTYLPDTLLAFRTCVISFDPVAFLSKKEIIIHKLRLERPDIYAFVDLNGKANWEILPNDADTTRLADRPLQPQLNLKGISISDAHIIYENRQQHIFIAADSLEMSLDGNMSKDSTGIDLKLGTKALTTHYEGQSFTKHLPVKIEARLQNNKILHRLTIRQALFTVGVLGVDVSGTIERKAVDQPAEVDVDFKLNASSLGELLDLIPKQMTDIGSKLKTTGKIDSYGKLSGRLGEGIYPLLTLSLRLEDGSLRSAEHPEKSGLKKIEADCNARIDFSNQTPSFVTIDSLYIESASSAIGLSGRFEDIFTRPFIHANAKGNINFTRMSQDLSFIKEMEMGGSIRLNLSGKCFLEDLLASNYGKLYADGTVDVDDVVFKYPKEHISLYAPSAKLRLGSNVTDSIRGQVQESLLRGSIDLDSLNFRQGDELLSNISRLSVRFSTEAPKDTNTIAVMTSFARLDRLNLTLGDSIRIRLVKTAAFLKLAPVPENPSKAELTARVTVDSLRARMVAAATRINDANLTLRIKKQEARTTQNRRFGQARADSTGVDSVRTAYRPDSLRRFNRQMNRESDLSFQLESQDAKEVLRQWDVSGSFECKSMNFRTPYFPLPVRMAQTALKFTTNMLSLSATRLKMGSSGMILSGEIEGIRRALLYNGRVTAKLTVDADTVNFNELIKAAVTGSEFAEKNVSQQDSISQIVLADNKEVAAVQDTTPPGVFVIPRNIDVELNTQMNTALYGQLTLNKASGKIIIRDQAVHLPDLKLNSELGNAEVSLAYKAADKKGAHLGMDLGMRQIDVKELIKAFPMMDTLTPMLRSFEGVVDCDMTMVTELDSLMNVRLPETTAACYMRGVNMVLLDGETFGEISKTLMFKNKKRNMIDSISVEMVLEDSKIMIFPFRVSIDRYQVGVGGTQNLDMTFDYHITVLKSPLPFKLGLNITGSPDKMKIRLAKAKYKDLFTPAKEKDLSATTINVRKQMDEKLKQSIAEIVRQPATASLRRPRTELPDSLKETFFKLDTTKVEFPQPEPVDSVMQSSIEKTD